MTGKDLLMFLIFCIGGGGGICLVAMVIYQIFSFFSSTGEQTTQVQSDAEPYRVNSDYFTVQQRSQDEIVAQGYQRQGMSLPEARQQAAKDRYD